MSPSILIIRVCEQISASCDCSLSLSLSLSALQLILSHGRRTLYNRSDASGLLKHIHSSIPITDIARVFVKLIVFIQRFIFIKHHAQSLQFLSFTKASLLNSSFDPLRNAQSLSINSILYCRCRWPHDLSLSRPVHLHAAYGHWRKTHCPSECGCKHRQHSAAGSRSSEDAASRRCVEVQLVVQSESAPRDDGSAVRRELNATE